MAVDAKSDAALEISGALGACSSLPVTPETAEQIHITSLSET